MRSYRFYSHRFSILCLCFLVFIYACHKKENTLFQRLDADDTHITFNNKLTANDTLNILDFEYMFNGGGVGIGDIDNDGLQDIYFTGNQVSGQLYLNQGGFKFKDITHAAKVSTQGWTNGVSMSDIDQDGLLDIYICRGGPRNTPDKDMANLVFMNQGNKTFKERGSEMGIADTGYSIQSLFFDYDQDGDNDLYVLTNELVDYNRNTTRRKIRDGRAKSTDRLYRNDGNGKFSDVSKEAGIIIEGFGLGATVCDIDRNGLPDVYVSNDFLTNDILYINNGNSTFTDKISEYVRHQSYNGMGSSIADINNDGLSDIIVLDMMPQDNKRLKQTMGYFSYDKFAMDKGFGYVPQFVRNTLQLNNGNGTFSEIGQLAGIHSTDWSWSPLVADFDNDGFKDIFITNGYRRDITNLDFIVYGQQAGYFGSKEGILKDKLKKLNSLPEVKLSNYVYHNNGDLSFTDTSKDWGITVPSYSNGAAYADLDNDGDLDLVVNNIDDPAHLYKNTTIEKTGEIDPSVHYLRIKLKGHIGPVGTKLSVYSNGVAQSETYSPVSGYLSTMDPVLHFGLGKAETVDSLKVIWPDGHAQDLKNIAADQTLELNHKEAIKSDSIPSLGPAVLATSFTDITQKLEFDYSHQEDGFIDFSTQPTLIHMNSKLGPGLAVGDVDNDGLEDFYIGGTEKKNGSLFTQNDKGKFTAKELPTTISQEDMGTLFLDVDSDADLDLILIGGGEDPQAADHGYLDRIYLNDGQGNFTENTLLKRADSGSCAIAADYDKDGDLDLFIGGRYVPEAYPLSPKSFILENHQGKYTDATQHAFGNDGKLGMVTDALWTDFDNDTWVDLIVVGEFMAPRFFKNEKGILKDISEETGLDHTSGWWNSIAAGDFDKDGDMDYVMGNWGLNSPFRASASEPISIYAKDFDKNGTIDPLISCYRQGEEHLIYARDVLANQITAMKGRFTTYDSYAAAPFAAMFRKDELEGASRLRAETLESGYLENLGNGKFNRKPLPLKAQFAPLFGMEIRDFNDDGNLDALLTGNFYSVEALNGQYDAFIGLCLLGDGQGGFTPEDTRKSGLKIDGDAKGLVQLQSADGHPVVLAGQNSGPLKAYSYDTGAKAVGVDPDIAYALIHLKNGAIYKHEFTYGSGYLSQSSRKLMIRSQETDSVELFSYTGQRKQLTFEDAK